jgi:transcriptional antiterminator NusG
MVMNNDVWYAIRNTPGVLGFVGSSGKGALPIPISIEEYNKVDETVVLAPTPVEEVSVVNTEEAPVLHTTDAKVGNTVEIINGSFAGLNGEVKSIDNAKGIVNVELEMFGRMTNVDLNFSDIKLAN